MKSYYANDLIRDISEGSIRGKPITWANFEKVAVRNMGFDSTEFPRLISAAADSGAEAQVRGNFTEAVALRRIAHTAANSNACQYAAPGGWVFIQPEHIARGSIDSLAKLPISAGAYFKNHYALIEMASDAMKTIRAESSNMRNPELGTVNSQMTILRNRCELALDSSNYFQNLNSPHQLALENLNALLDIALSNSKISRRHGLLSATVLETPHSAKVKKLIGIANSFERQVQDAERRKSEINRSVYRALKLAVRSGRTDFSSSEL